MKITDTALGETDLYMIYTEDGPASTFDFFVVAFGVDGKEYRHELNINCRYTAERLSEKVKNFGEINLEYWREIPYRPSYALGEVDEVSLMDDAERAIRGV